MDITAISHPVPVAVTELPNPQWLLEDREWIQMVKSINASELQDDQRELTFAMDRLSRRPVVRVIDRQTHAILQQFPPEYLLEFQQQLGQQIARMQNSNSPDKG